MKQRAILLLSGGLDSIANLYAAQADSQFEIAMAITFHYGQKAAKREIQVARYHCRRLNIPHKVVKTSLFSQHSHSALTSDQVAIPSGDQDIDILSFETSQKSATAVWVPNRNGLFLNIAAFFAEAMDVEWVMIGFNQEEAQTFPDNSLDFLKACNAFFAFSTRNQVKVKSYTVLLTKPQIIEKYARLFAPHTIWPCYQSFQSWCGECESCKRFKAAIETHGLVWEELLAQNQVFIQSL